MRIIELREGFKVEHLFLSKQSGWNRDLVDQLSSALDEAYEGGYQDAEEDQSLKEDV